MSHPVSSPIRLAHLSDIHLPPPLPISWLTMLNKRALSALSWHYNRQHHHLLALSQAVVEDIGASHPDLITMTGDLTNFGLPTEIDTGATWMAGLPAPAVMVPGNHDQMTGLSWEKGLAAWSAWMAPSPNMFPYVRRLGDVAIIGVNSAVPSPPFMAYGRVGQKQGERLGAILRRTQGCCRVVLIHHPPRAGLVPWRKSLLDAAKIGTIIRASGAELVLHGHSHNGSLTTIKGSDIPLVGVPSASLLSEKPWRQAGWNALSIERKNGAWVIALTRRHIAALGQPPADLSHYTFIRPAQ